MQTMSQGALDKMTRRGNCSPNHAYHTSSFKFGKRSKRRYCLGSSHFQAASPAPARCQHLPQRRGSHRVPRGYPMARRHAQSACSGRAPGRCRAAGGYTARGACRYTHSSWADSLASKQLILCALSELRGGNSGDSSPTRGRLQVTSLVLWLQQPVCRGWTKQRQALIKLGSMVQQPVFDVYRL